MKEIDTTTFVITQSLFLYCNIQHMLNISVNLIQIPI